jgi:hypothetical protein
MRKFLLMLLVVLTMPAFAQGDYQFRIASFMSEDGYETQNYQYSDVLGTDLKGIHEIDLLEEIECIDSLVYDENGNITSLQTYQLLDGQWLKVCWVDYTYNEMGLRATRTNYNDFHDGWGPQIGGVYYYTYNEEGKLIQRDLDFAGIMYEKATYSYNEAGQLEAEVLMVNPFTGVYENSGLTEYYYDENGYLTESLVYFWDGATWGLQTSFIQVYDEAGNCIESSTATAAGSVQEKKVYKYNDKVSADKIFHYSNPEDDFPSLPQMKNMLESYEYYAMDQTSGALVYVIDYLLMYDVIGEDDPEDDTTSVNNISVNTRIYPNPTTDYVMVESEEVDFVQVLDICGRELFATEVRGTLAINMKEYEAGVYFLRLHSNGATSVQKVVKN